MAVGRHDFAVRVLLGLGAPVTQENLTAMLAWMQAEGSRYRFNPLATTLSVPGATGSHVKNYRSFQQGVEATVQTLLRGRRSYGYSAIISALKRGERAEAVLQAVQDSAWAAGHYNRAGGTVLSSLAPSVRADFTRYAAAPLGTTIVGSGGGAGGVRGGGVAGPRVPFPYDLTDIVNQALVNGFTAPEVLAQLAKDPKFRRTYPGIVRPDGTFRMTVAEYIFRSEQFRSIAAQFGFNLGRSHIGQQIAFDRSPEEFTEIAKAIQKVRSDPQMFAALAQQVDEANRSRIERGLKPYSSIRTTRDAVNFALGRGDRQVYELYEAAQFFASAQGAGLEVSGARARQLARQTPGILSFADTEAAFANIAERLRTGGVELRTYGLTQRDLETIEFGGSNRSALASKALQALRQAEAARKPRTAGPALGLKQGRPVVTTTPLPEPGF